MHRVLPLGPAATRLRAVQAEVLCVQAQRVRRAAQTVGEREEIAALAQADTDRIVLMGQTGGPRPPAQEDPAPGANLFHRATKPVGDVLGRQTGRCSGREQRDVRRRPARGATRRDAQARAPSDDRVGRAPDAAGDVRDGQQVGVELAEQLVLSLAPAPGQRSPRAGWRRPSS